MLERELVAIIENEVSAAIGGSGGGSGAISSGVTGTTNAHSQDLATERAMELDYYNSRPFGNEREGESQVVSSDVFDAVEGMLPHLLKTFTASDDAVEFQPEGMEDEEAARQRTDVCNYVFYRQNNGFLLMYEWFKDALIQKNGIVKYWWESKTEVTEESYQGLTEGEYLMLLKDEGLQEVLEHSAYDDPAALEQKQAMLQKVQAMPANVMPMQAGPQMNPTMMLEQIEQMPIPQLHDVKANIAKQSEKVCIKAIPPEEFGISAKHNSVSIQDAPFVYHRTKMTLSALREMGCPDEIIDSLGSDGEGGDDKPEVLSRNRFTDEGAETEEVDPSTREVWVTDCFMRVDDDDDGIAELRHIIMPARTIWINEKSSHINFAAITPIIMPHRFIGKSIAEAVMDFQFMNSVLLRQMFNNLYLTNNPQKVVLGSQGGIIQADLDRLMTSRVGGILIEYTPNAIRNQEVPFVAGASFPMLEYLEGKKEQRTGNTRYNQGTDADSLNKTARGIQMIQSAAQQKIDLIARIFAETGIKDLFRGIAYFLSKYPTKPMTMRLRNKWVDIDPRQWKTQFDMTVNVGLGTGNKDAQLVHLVKMNEVQLELMKTGRGYMVTDQNVYNLARKMGENMGFKQPEMFITDPQQPQAQQAKQQQMQQPNPEVMKLQQADAEAKMKIQSTEKIRLFDAQTQKELEGIKAQAQIAIAQIESETERAIATAKIEADKQIELFKAQCSMREESLNLDKKRAEIGYKESVLAIKKQTQGGDGQAPAGTVIVDGSGEVTSGIKDMVGVLAQGINQSAVAMQNAADSTRQIVEQQASKQDQLSATVAQLAAQKPKNGKRRHTVKKTGDGGYEITSSE